MNTPCQNIIQSAIRARALALVRRHYTETGHTFTPNDASWLRQQCPDSATGTSIERALTLAGLGQAAGRLVHEFYVPGDPSTLRQIVLAAIATQPSCDPTEDIE